MSGGVYGSPQLLQLSGVGPAEHLQQLGIPVVRDMPGVGTNLHDHFNTYRRVALPQPVTLNDLANSLLRKLVAGVQYVFSRSGPLASNGIYAGALVRSDPRFEQPDIQINMFGLERLRAAADGVMPHPFSAFTYQPGASAPGRPRHGPAQERRPAGAAGDPVQFSGSANDYQALIFGPALCAQDRGAAGAAAVRREEMIPGAAVRPTSRLSARSARAASPTCTRSAPAAWGARSTPWSIRGSGARHRRPARRRCLDHAAVPGGNTNAPSIMIGEKCADMVRQAAQ